MGASPDPLAFHLSGGQAHDLVGADHLLPELCSKALAGGRKITISIVIGPSWELRDRSSNALVSSGTGSWQAGQPIALNGFELSLDGVPASGDSFKVGRTAFPESSNTNAAAMVGLRDARIVGKLLDRHGSAMAGVGVRVSSTKAAADISSAVATNAKNRKESATGVNLDEEAARLIQFQQSYQAAAKVLTVAQTIFDTLLQAAAR